MREEEVEEEDVKKEAGEKEGVGEEEEEEEEMERLRERKRERAGKERKQWERSESGRERTEERRRNSGGSRGCTDTSITRLYSRVPLLADRRFYRREGPSHPPCPARSPFLDPHHFQSPKYWELHKQIRFRQAQGLAGPVNQ